MRFASLLIAALAVIPGVIADGWFLGPTLISSFLDDTTPFLRSRSDYPRYEVVDDDEKFQVAFDVQGVKMEEIHVSLEEGGTALLVSGYREVSDVNYSFRTSFSQSFSLDPSVQVDKLVATVKDGVLVCSVPKDKTKMRETSRLIPITNLDAIESSNPKEEVMAQPFEEKLPDDNDVKQKVMDKDPESRLSAKHFADSGSEILAHWEELR
jgi:HSP20 family protein